MEFPNRASVNVHPGPPPRRKRCGYPSVRGALLVAIRGGKLRFGDLEYRASHPAVAAAIEHDVRMMRPSDGDHELRAQDLHWRQREPKQLVPLPPEPPSERRELNACFLESAVGEE